MTFKQFLTNLKAKLTTAPETERPAIQAQIAELEALEEPAPVTTPAQGVPASGDAGIIAAAIERALAPINEQVKGLSEMLEAEKVARATATTALQAQQQAARKIEIDTLVDQAVIEGRIANDEAKIKSWKERAGRDFDAAKEFINELPKSTVVNRQTTATGKPGEKSEGGKKYDSAFAKSLPPAFMKYAEESIAE